QRHILFQPGNERAGAGPPAGAAAGAAGFGTGGTSPHGGRSKAVCTRQRRRGFVPPFRGVMPKSRPVRKTKERKGPLPEAAASACPMGRVLSILVENPIFLLYHR